jgi:hypothetical protein
MFSRCNHWFPAPLAPSVESSDSPPRRPKTKRRVKQEQNGFITIDRNLEEDFTRMVQDGAGDREWETFCQKEKRRLAQKDQDWIDWMDDESDRNSPEDNLEAESSRWPKSPSEESKVVKKPHDSPPEPSATLRTPPRNSTKPKLVKKKKTTRPIVREVSARRLRTIRRTTACTFCGEVPKIVRRTYQRKENHSRTVSKRRLSRPEVNYPEETDDGPTFLSFCLRVAADDLIAEQEEERSIRRETQPTEHPGMHTGQRPDHHTPTMDEMTRDLAEMIQRRERQKNLAKQNLRRNARRREQSPVELTPWRHVRPTEGTNFGKGGADAPVDNEDTDPSPEEESDGLSILEPIKSAIDSPRNDIGRRSETGGYARHTPRPDSEILPASHVPPKVYELYNMGRKRPGAQNPGRTNQDRGEMEWRILHLRPPKEPTR